MKATWKRLTSRHRKGNFLVVLGHINVDVVYELSKFPVKGQSINTGNVMELFGGTAGNIALHASALGLKTAIGCYVGSDFSPDFRKLLMESGVDCHDVIMVEGERTPRCHIFDTPDGEQTYIIEQGAMASTMDLPLWEDSISDSSVIHIATGDPDRYIRAVGKRSYSFDPGQEINYRYNAGKFRKMLGGANIFFTNEIEMKMALKLTGAVSEKQLAKRCGTVIKTEGSRGTAIIQEDGVTRVPACRVKNYVDTIGAGDAFRAGYYAAMEKGYNIVKCVEFGNAMASIAIEGKGGVGSLASYRQLEKRWNENYGPSR